METATVRLQEVRGIVTEVRTRIPFKYGAVVLTASPHLCLEGTLEVNGETVKGLAADTLPPGWFDKSPGKSYPEQVADQLSVIRWAQGAVLGREGTAFDLWLESYGAVRRSAQEAGLPDLLAAFGASMVERLLWDGIGRAFGASFTTLVRENAFGVDLAAVDPALAGIELAAVIPPTPRERVWARHTVGLSDPLRDEDIPSGEVVADALPQSLASCLKAYGYRYLKIKLANDLDADVDRLHRIAEVIEQAETGGGRILCTLDGNEQYGYVSELTDLIEAIESDPRLGLYRDRVVYIEQPIARDKALDPSRLEGFDRIAARYPLIIDESDGTLDAYPAARALGYSGTSHKNCKGIVKSLANAARNRLDQGRRAAVQSGEDLVNVGPIALPQDLAVAAALGVLHVERNGHHFFSGLSHLARPDADAVITAHPGLYTHLDDMVTLRIESGAIDCRGLQGPGLGGVLPTVTDGWRDWESYDPHRELV